MSLKYIIGGPINNMPALIKTMGCRPVDDKPSYEPVIPDATMG